MSAHKRVASGIHEDQAKVALLRLWRSHWSIENNLFIRSFAHYPSIKYAREHFAVRPFRAFALLELPV
jgi:hypothetical protein